MAEHFTIKPLEWEEFTAACWLARSTLGEYYVWAYQNDCSWAASDFRGTRPCASADEGKAAAEADYRARMMAGLVPVTSDRKEGGANA
jgi:hypothetical protein